MNKLTAFDRYLLKIVAKGKGEAKWSWHDIGIITNYTGREGERNMLVALKELEQQGLVRRFVQPNNPEDRWEITEKGEQILANDE